MDEILPHVPLRQWVLAAPFELHHRLARDPELERKVLAVFIDEIERFLYGAVSEGEARLAAPVAQSEGGPARAGFFTATQHFGSALNLHVHWHVLCTDGLYEQRSDGTLAFLRATTPTAPELAEVVRRVSKRVHGLVGPPDENAEPIDQAPALKLVGAEPRVPAEPSLAAEHDGFNLHAALAFQAHERIALERLCRSMMRGPLAAGRLRKGPRSKLIYDLKEPRADGTTQIVLSPLALLQRLSWLCVLPRAHTTHSHGVLAPPELVEGTSVAPAQDEKPGMPPLRGCASRWIVLRHAQEGLLAETGFSDRSLALRPLRRQTPDRRPDR